MGGWSPLHQDESFSACAHASAMGADAAHSKTADGSSM
jgi:hypothetical protein